MAWTTEDIMKFTEFLTRKNQSGSIRAADLTYAWNNQQSAMQSDLIGRYQARNNSRMGPNTGFIENETATTLLQPFFISASLPVNNGELLLPVDFLYKRALLINGKRVVQYNKDQEWAINGSVIDPPDQTTDTWYYTELKGINPASDSGIYMIDPPVVTGSAVLDYIQQAPDIRYVAQFDAQGRPSYDATNSISPKWRQNAIVEITKRTLAEFGVSFKDQDFEQYGKSVIATGE